jgi:heat shock protein HslJ
MCAVAVSMVAAAEPMPPVGIVWAWQSAQFADGRRIAVAASERYTIEFSPDGTLRVRADCNRGSARYAVDGVRLSIGPVATTKKGCADDSHDRDFVAALEHVRGFRGDDRELVLTLAASGSWMHFAPVAR